MATRTMQTTHKKIIMSLAVVLMLGLLIATLLPALSAARRTPRQMQSHSADLARQSIQTEDAFLSNEMSFQPMRQVLGTSAYADTHDLPSFRARIDEAQMQLQADAVAEIEQLILTELHQVNGYVQTQRASGEDANRLVTWVFRVPANQLAAFQKTVRGMDLEVISEELKSTDVTDQMVDVEARLTNLRATEVELRAILTEVRDHDQPAKEVMEVHRQLSSVREKIERLAAQQASLQNRVSMATLRLSLSAKPLPPTIVTEGWQVSVIVREAAATLVTTGRWATTWLIYVGIVLLPWTVVLGLVCLIARRVVKRFGRDVSISAGSVH